MGFLWDLVQQSELATQNARTRTLEERVAGLETELAQVRTALRELVDVLERRFGEDLNGDGYVGEE